MSAAQPQPIKTTGIAEPPKMVEVPDPKFVKFEREGDEVTGVYVGAVSVHLAANAERPKGQDVTKHRMLGWDWNTNRHTDEVLEFLGTYQLDQKLREKHAGHVVTVKWAESKEVGRGNKMKVFRVFVSEDPYNAAATEVRRAAANLEKSLQITDEDIPF